MCMISLKRKGAGSAGAEPASLSTIRLRSGFDLVPELDPPAGIFLGNHDIQRCGEVADILAIPEGGIQNYGIEARICDLRDHEG